MFVRKGQSSLTIFCAVVFFYGAVLCFLVACQKQQVGYAELDEPKDSPEYTVQPEIFVPVKTQ
jgi:hypothetical protein